MDIKLVSEVLDIIDKTKFGESVSHESFAAYKALKKQIFSIFL